MKKITVFYWIITIIFAGFMLFSGITNASVNKESVDLITGFLGFPEYFIPFIGIAKILGSIAILIPGLKALKEWAYAGLFFDLVAATYAIVYKGGLNFQIIFMILPIVFLFLSYWLWKKKEGMVK